MWKHNNNRCELLFPERAYPVILTGKCNIFSLKNLIIFIWVFACSTKEKVRESPKSMGFIFRDSLISVPNYNFFNVIEILCGLVVQQTTDISIPRVMAKKRELYLKRQLSCPNNYTVIILVSRSTLV